MFTKDKKPSEVLNGLVGGFYSLAIGNYIAKSLLNKKSKRENLFKKVKGGTIYNMETKSRYEVIAELESQKRELILKKDGLNEKLKNMRKQLRDMKREVEDQKEEIKDFEKEMKNQEKTYETLIKGVDESLKRMTELNKN